jgi:mono/diheme cytochrome c family protein
MRTTRIALASAAVALGVIALAAIAAESPAPSTPKPTASPEAAVPATIPDAEKRRKNPREATAESIDVGHQFFSSQCTMCHGESGDGKGVLVARLGMAVPDFGDPALQDRRTDGEFFYVLTKGHGRMPGEGERLPETVRWDLVNFIRSLRRK